MDSISDYVIRRTRLTKTMVDILASDVIETSKANLKNENIQSLEQVLNHSKALIDISKINDSILTKLE